jgi:hypothetical protein
MPVIARFYGIVIKIYFRQSEHNPPHIHALYGEHMGVLNIQTLEVMEGDLPSKAVALVQEWMKPLKAELLEIWNTQNFKQLPPLE